MDDFIRVFQRIADVVPAVTFVEVAAGRPEMQFVIPGASRVADNMLLKFSRQPVSPGGFIDIQRSQPWVEILPGN